MSSARLPLGGAVTVTGPATTQDGLTWWPVHAVLASGVTVAGYAAEAVGGNVLLHTERPLVA